MHFENLVLFMFQCFICIKNDLIEIAHFSTGAISIIFYEPLFQNQVTSGAKLFMHYSKCMCQFKFRTRSSHCKVQMCEGVNNLIREILIKIASFHSTYSASKNKVAPQMSPFKKCYGRTIFQ